MCEALLRGGTPEPPDEHVIFERIASGLAEHGFCVLDQALPGDVIEGLAERVRALSAAAFHAAAVGREQDQMQNAFIRRDEIRWIEGEEASEQAWLAWSGRMQTYLNRRLFLGLFSFECHFAHYPPGAFYKRHVDAFRGEANRILTTVLYLNPGWTTDDGGEMLLYPEEGDDEPRRIRPQLGTLAVFLSEAFPHEVLPARCDRFSIAGWFRLNASTAGRVDPPR
ncbi:MAG: 2OG-Fe(II) oxygenase [Rhodocyclaceae bacterium]|nr:2OG-Fe(II) oxygenase [Rhodocyclaceae bacterium]